MSNEWIQILSNYPGEISAEEFLLDMARCGEDLNSLFDQWRTLESGDAWRHLARSIDVNAITLLRERRLANPEWEKYPQAANTYKEFLMHPRSRVTMEYALFDKLNDPVREEFARAVDRLAMMRRVVTGFTV